MGITGLARWVNAPITGVELISQNIRVNHNGVWRSTWKLEVRSYRSSAMERTMCALVMNENVFVLLDDPFAPTRADLLMNHQDPSQPPPDPPHYRNTFLTLRPPGALEQLLLLLRARWQSTRQSAPGASQNRKPPGPQLTIDGHVFTIGNDWIVRFGNVVLAGGTIKGMLLEAEYVPVPTISSQQMDSSAGDLLSNLLVSVLPNVRDAKTNAVTISDAQWEDVLWDKEAEESAEQEAEKEKGRVRDPDDIFVVGDEDLPTHRKGDWTGIDRDRRSAYLIIGALKSEGLV